MNRLKVLNNAFQKCCFIRSYNSSNGYYGYRPETSAAVNRAVPKVVRLQDVVDRFRRNGYLHASINPLDQTQRGSVLDDFSDSSIDSTGNGITSAEINGVLKHLEASYCGNVAFEVRHIQNEEEQQWFYDVAENLAKVHFSDDQQKNMLECLLKSQVFDNFLSKKFPTLKRYSGEGCESLLVFFNELFKASSAINIEDILVSTQHRGRLNLLTVLLHFPHSLLFHKIKGNPEYNSKYEYTGDVVSHLTSSTQLRDHDNLHVTMVPNPSHLEVSHSVLMGKTRSKQLSKQYGPYGSRGNKIVNVLVHGDAAIAGQGVVMESLCLSGVPHFNVGGSIHIILNNHIGFTTPDDRASSMTHCSDVVKMNNTPIIHVNGDHPEDVAKVAMIALDYKMRFMKDVMVNLHCFRRWGHNEIDDPTITNPCIYKIIHSRPSVPDLYKEKLLNEDVINETQVEAIEKKQKVFLDGEFAKSDEFHGFWSPFGGAWSDMRQAGHGSISVWDTGCDVSLLKFVGAKSAEVTASFNMHARLKKSFANARIGKINSGTELDWATAEALAVGTLLSEGHHVRLCGQDVGRGTFNHRHFMLVDQQSGEVVFPLNCMYPDQQSFLEVVNSPLSEEAVLGFEYGVSIDNPKQLVIWEAQFGDFFNAAQVVIDTYVSSGELKWLLQSGLVMLLPHGMDGAGPDHSSCKIERFLQLSDSSEVSVDGDDVNMQIVNPTTPAQYFHVLRRQQVRNYRKPLIVASPKLILRLAAATSSLAEMQPGTYFKPVLSDDEAVASEVKRVVFCSGKHYYELKKQREILGKKNMALIRLEALVPFPAEEIKTELKKYINAEEYIWCQEEHRNQGAWSFVQPRFQNLINMKLNYIGRPVYGASAVGVTKWHSEECKKINDAIFLN